MRRTKAAALETKAKILESALDIFSEKSFSNASLTEIAANVGLTKGALYWHFKNKNDLLLQLMKEICKHGEDKVKNLFNTPDSVGKLRKYYKDSLILLLKDDRNKKIHKIMTKRDEWPEDIQQSVRQIIKESIGKVHLQGSGGGPVPGEYFADGGGGVNQLHLPRALRDAAFGYAAGRISAIYRYIIRRLYERIKRKIIIESL